MLVLKLQWTFKLGVWTFNIGIELFRSKTNKHQACSICMLDFICNCKVSLRCDCCTVWYLYFLAPLCYDGDKYKFHHYHTCNEHNMTLVNPKTTLIVFQWGRDQGKIKLNYQTVRIHLTIWPKPNYQTWPLFISLCMLLHFTFYKQSNSVYYISTPWIDYNFWWHC